MKTALITGVVGQDGSYLAELLVSKGYRVIGAVRNPETDCSRLPGRLSKDIELVGWNMSSQSQMAEVIDRVRPEEIYNFAAYSSGIGMYDEPVGICDVNGLAVARILEAIRQVDSRIRFSQASSREVFGEAMECPQNECTSRNPRSPYGAAKQLADSMVRIYRHNYGIFASSAVLYNHESPRRSLSFVTRKVTHEAARIKRGLATELRLGNLEAQRDWGFAGDYVRAMWLMLQQPRADDYVVCTGESHSVRNLCDYAFCLLDLDYRDYVTEDQASHRPAEPVPLVGSYAKARHELGWEPETTFESLVQMMVTADLQMLG